MLENENNVKIYRRCIANESKPVDLPQQELKQEEKKEPKYRWANLRAFVANTNKKMEKKYAVYALSVCFLLVFTMILSYFYAPGYTVFFNGMEVGKVKSKEEFQQIYKNVSDTVYELSGKENDITGTPTFLFQLISKRNFTEEEEIGRNLLSFSSALIEGYDILVDGAVVTSVKSQEDGEKAVNLLKEQAKESEDAQIEVLSDITFEKKYILASKILPAEYAAQELKNTRMVQKEHVVESQDSLWSLSREHGTTIDAILGLNPGLDENLIDGQTIVIPEEEPIVSLKATQRLTYEEAIPFQSEEIADDSLYQGKSEVLTQGVDGKQLVEADVTKINGEVVEKNVLSSEVLAAPVTQVMKVGTKEVPNGVGSGIFSTPYLGVVTSRFGSRWGGRHTGVDLAGSVGDPVECADEGEVTYAQYNDGGYGYMVIVDHNNGYETYYAHLNEIDVQVGDVLAKGDVLGKVGNTGFSTGPHLHFEVRKDGVPQDPQQYISR